MTFSAQTVSDDALPSNTVDVSNFITNFECRCPTYRKWLFTKIWCGRIVVLNGLHEVRIAKRQLSFSLWCDLISVEFLIRVSKC